VFISTSIDERVYRNGRRQGDGAGCGAAGLVVAAGVASGLVEFMEKSELRCNSVRKIGIMVVLDELRQQVGVAV
jgi:hypothetical protein